MQHLGGLLSSGCTEESHGHGTVKDSYLSDLSHQVHCLFSLVSLQDRGHKPRCSPRGSWVVDIQLCVSFACYLDLQSLLQCLAKISSQGGVWGKPAFFYSEEYWRQVEL